jgi:integrase
MVKQSIYDMLARRAKQAGIENFSPHDLRRTFITDILEAGADLSTAAKLAGHKSPQTTMRYDKRDNKVKMQAVSLLHIPFSG